MSPPSSKRIISINIQTRPRHPESNSIVERFNSTVHDESNNDYGDNSVQPEVIIAQLMQHYNEERLHATLGYMTPATWHRRQPDEVRHERARQIAAARAHRRMTNQQAIYQGGLSSESLLSWLKHFVRVDMKRDSSAVPWCQRRRSPLQRCSLQSSTRPRRSTRLCATLVTAFGYLMQGLLLHNMQTAHASLAAHIIPYSRTTPPLTGIKGLELLNQQVTTQAELITYIDDFKFLMVAILMALPLLLFVRSPGRIQKSVTTVVVE